MKATEIEGADLLNPFLAAHSTHDILDNLLQQVSQGCRHSVLDGSKPSIHTSSHWDLQETQTINQIQQ